ncbi:MAG: hypothetical protein KGL10_02160 [Alphaproteobacteria bacterium]|nr:hypothetical protein [Alphaproteobacteria bacterium]MDE2336093.1 hypothetical protein [Alphaproteobacteria bacterium]
MTACIPVGDQQINSDLFKSRQDMEQRAAMLHPGMTEDAVFEKICISKGKFTHMSLPEVQMSLYGNSVVQGSPTQLDNFRRQLMAYQGYYLPYSDISDSGSLGFGSLRVNKTGYVLRLVLIFQHGKLLQASIDGNQDVNQYEDKSLFNVLLQKTTGVSF